MESNPSYDKKAAPALSEEDMKGAVKNCLEMFAQAVGLKSLIDEDSSFVECSAAEGNSLSSVMRSFKAMSDSASQGSENFGKGRSVDNFVDTFTKLALGADDVVTDDGVSFADLNSFVTLSYFEDAEIQ